MSVVKVMLTHSVSKAVVAEKRFELSKTIGQIKANIATHFATPTEQMTLKLLDDAGQTVEPNMQDDKMLGYYQCRDGYTIHVIDNQPNAPSAHDEFSDVSKVEKFEIDEKAYAARTDNARAFRERMVAQQRAEAEKAGIKLPTELHSESYKEVAEKIKAGDRCKVFPGDRLGAVRFVGPVPGLKPGYWVGVEYDEPVGKNDGAVGKVRYFQCFGNHGGFVRPDQVTVGDFPPEEL